MSFLEDFATLERDQLPPQLFTFKYPSTSNYESGAPSAAISFHVRDDYKNDRASEIYDKFEYRSDEIGCQFVLKYTPKSTSTEEFELEAIIIADFYMAEDTSPDDSFEKYEEARKVYPPYMTMYFLCMIADAANIPLMLYPKVYTKNNVWHRGLFQAKVRSENYYSTFGFKYFFKIFNPHTSKTILHDLGDVDLENERPFVKRVGEIYKRLLPRRRTNVFGDAIFPFTHVREPCSPVDLAWIEKNCNESIEECRKAMLKDSKENLLDSACWSQAKHEVWPFSNRYVWPLNTPT